MTLNLSTLAIMLGLGFALPQLYGLANPSGFAAALRKFPRSLPWGVVLMLLGTGWFLWNVEQEPISDIAAAKPYLEVAFAGIGIGACFYVQDFLAVRGLAVVLLLLGKLMVDTGRPALNRTDWVLVIQSWAYVMIVAGIWLTVSPWRLRNFIEWCTANDRRIKIGCGIRLAFGLLVAALGAFKF